MYSCSKCLWWQIFVYQSKVQWAFFNSDQKENNRKSLKRHGQHYSILHKIQDCGPKIGNIFISIYISLWDYFQDIAWETENEIEKVCNWDGHESQNMYNSIWRNNGIKTDIKQQRECLTSLIQCIQRWTKRYSVLEKMELLREIFLRSCHPNHCHVRQGTIHTSSLRMGEACGIHQYHFSIVDRV